MLPLFTVYVSEYLINQAISPTLLFPLASTPFTRFRDFYPTYSSSTLPSIPFLPISIIFRFDHLCVSR